MTSYKSPGDIANVDRRGEPLTDEGMTVKPESPMEVFQRVFLGKDETLVSMEELIRNPRGTLRQMLDRFDKAIETQASEAAYHKRQHEEALTKNEQAKGFRDVLVAMYEKVTGDAPVVKTPVSVDEAPVARVPSVVGVPVFNYKISYLAHIHSVIVEFLQGCNKAVKRVDIQRYVDDRVHDGTSGHTNVVYENETLTYDRRSDYIHQVITKLVTTGLVSRPDWGKYQWVGGPLGTVTFVNAYGKVTTVPSGPSTDIVKEPRGDDTDDASGNPALLLHEWHRLSILVGTESPLQRDIFQMLWEDGPLTINDIQTRFNGAAMISSALYGLQSKEAITRDGLRGVYQVAVNPRLLNEAGRVIHPTVDSAPGAPPVTVYNVRSGKKVSVGVQGMESGGTASGEAAASSGVQSAGEGESRAAEGVPVPWAGVSLTKKQRAVVEALARAVESTAWDFAHYTKVSSLLPDMTDSGVHSLLSRLRNRGVLERYDVGVYGFSRTLLESPVPQLNARGKKERWNKYADELVSTQTPAGGWSSAALLKHLQLRYAEVTMSAANGYFQRRVVKGRMTRVDSGHYLWVEGVTELERKAKLAAARKYRKEDPQANWHKVVVSYLAQNAKKDHSTSSLHKELYSRGVDVTDNAVLKYMNKLLKSGELKKVAYGTYQWSGGVRGKAALFPLPPVRRRGTSRPKRKQQHKTGVLGTRAWSKSADALLRKHAQNSLASVSWTPKWLHEKMQAHGFAQLGYMAVFHYIKRRMEKDLIVKVADGEYRWKLPKQHHRDDVQQIVAAGGEWNVDDLYGALLKKGHTGLPIRLVGEALRQLLIEDLVVPGVGKNMFVWKEGGIPISRSAAETTKKADADEEDENEAPSPDLHTRSRTRNVVLNILKSSKNAMSPKEVELAARKRGYHHITYKSVMWHLRQLLKDGEATKPSGGLYQAEA